MQNPIGNSSACGAVVRQKRPGLAVLVGAVGAGVLLEGFLRQAVEGEGGDGAFETRRCDAPGAVGAAPACDSFILSPDHASRHECTS